MPKSRHLAALTTGLLMLVAGCGGSGGPAMRPTTERLPNRWPAASGDPAALSTHRAGCEVLAGDARPGGVFTFVVTDPVAPTHAPVPENQSERLVFAQLYETLVNVACDGTIAPGLATSWSCTEDSTSWQFTLREDARFWDGTRVTAADVQRAWTQNQQRHARHQAGSPWNWITPADRTITAVDANHLTVRLPEPQAQFPWLLAHPAAAVSVSRAGWTWPVGSGPARLRASDPAPMPDLRCLPNRHHPALPIWKSITFQVVPGGDPRDLVTGPVDLLLAGGTETAAFFRQVPGFRALPLPWSRLYLLVCPPRLNRDGPGAWANATQNLRVSRDMGTIAARPWPHVVFPAGGGENCPQLNGPIAQPVGSPLDPILLRNRLDERTIAYLGTDPGSAELAARLSHLAGPETRVAACTAADLALALQDQLAGACVLTQDQIFPTSCLQWAAFIGRAAWLQKAALVAPDDVVLPLALSHRWLIVRGELAGLRLDFDGTPLLAGLGRAAAPEVAP